jgi:hypothetical protein
MAWRPAARGPLSRGHPRSSCDAQAEGKKKEQFVMSVAWSPDYRRLACGAMDGTVVVFDVDSRKVLPPFSALTPGLILLLPLLLPACLGGAREGSGPRARRRLRCRDGSPCRR